MSKAEAKVQRTMFESWRFDPVQMMRDAGFEPDPHQVRLLEREDQNTLVLWPRQAGKSQTLATRVLHQAYFDPGDIVILAGEKQKQAQEVYEKAYAMHQILARKGDVPPVNRAGDELEFGKDSRVLACPSTVESIRGYAAKLVLIDEAAFTDDKTLGKVSPMLTTTNGRIICSSTPNGASGWFYKAWHGMRDEPEEDDGDDEPMDWARDTVSVEEMLAYPNARLTPRELKRQRMLLTHLAYRQEYGLEFLDGAFQFFPTELVELAIQDTGGALW